MKEIEDICRAFAEAQDKGLRAALATVVKVEGSSYRRPGARMLVREDGQLTGAISGGCLEGDALRKALYCIERRKNKLVVYDSMDDDGAFGIQLGCNGIVHLLLEPIQPDSAGHPIELLQRLIARRRPGVLVTVFDPDTEAENHPGTCLLYLENSETCNIDSPLHAALRGDAQKAFRLRQSSFSDYKSHERLLTGFIEYCEPPVALVIAGAGNDAIPLAQMASGLGWHVSVIDGRRTHATAQRFAMAQQVQVVKAGEPIVDFRSDARTAFMLMTHNYRYDVALLRQALAEECFYIGVLGPKKKLEQMLEELQSEGMVLSDIQRSQIFGPAGLDIGAETAEEIALSIVAEIQAVMQRRQGAYLRDKTDAIHSRPSHGG